MIVLGVVTLTFSTATYTHREMRGGGDLRVQVVHGGNEGDRFEGSDFSLGK